MFDGSKLKVKRATQHIAELEAVIAALIKPDAYRLWVENEPYGTNVLKFRMLKPIRCDIPLIIGDAIHNLRSALDLAACEIITMAGQQPSKWTSFPVRDTRQELESTVNSGEIKIAGVDIVDLIINVIKPYKGGNDPLHALHNLDIIDKHRLLIPVITITGLNKVTLRSGGTVIEEFSATVFPGREETQIMSHDSPMELDGDHQVTLLVLFDKGQIFESEAVVPTLYKLAQIVSGVLQALEQAYLARNQIKP